MFSIVLHEILYIGVSLEFRAETIEGKHYLSIYNNSTIPWLMEEYNDIDTAESKLKDIITVVESGHHIDLDTLLVDVEDLT